MTKVYPNGNPNRVVPNDQAIIRFALPADCPVANPPLELCVVVWDNSLCDHQIDIGNRCDGNYVGSSGIISAGSWSKTGRARFCHPGMLTESRVPRMAETEVNMLIGTSRGQNKEGYLSLIMSNPGRALVIPINKFR